MIAAGDAVAEVLAAGGVRRFYTVPGESFLEILDAVERSPELRLVSTRHESGAAFMADADAKVAGVPAVVAGTRGVGAANLAIGVHTAFQDSTPMIVMLGQVDSGFLGREGFQEVDLETFYRPITKWAATVHRTDRIPELVAHALRVARSGRPGPVMLAFPADVLAGELEADALALGRRRVGMRVAVSEPTPFVAGEIAARLGGAAKPVIVAGGGASSARASLVGVAEAYSTGVYASFRRQDVFPNDHPLYLGHLSVGVGGARTEALRNADFVLVVGCRLSEVTTGGYELPSPTSEVMQIDIDPSVLGAVAPVSLGVVADARAALDALLAARAGVAVPVRDWSGARQAFEAAAAVPPSRAEVGCDPAQVVSALAAAFPEDTVVANDAGNFSAFLHQHWLYTAPRSQVAPTSGAMGYGVPAAIGAKVAAPDRTVVAVAGDGGFAMSGAELETAVREGIDITVVVMRNGLYGTIAMHQARAFGRLSGVEIGDLDVAGWARSLGAAAATVIAEDELVDAFAEARAVDGPSLVDVLVDPNVIAPGTTLADAMSSSGSLARRT